MDSFIDFESKSLTYSSSERSRKRRSNLNGVQKWKVNKEEERVRWRKHILKLSTAEKKYT